MKALVSLRSKLLPPCKKLFLRFTFKLRKPLRLLRIRFHSRATKSSLTSLPTNPTFSPVSSYSHSRQQRRRKMNRVMQLRSISPEDENKLFPSPVTPSYIKAFRSANLDACTSFEDYLAAMIVEEGRTRDDLMDVEELVHCSKNLNYPVFIHAVYSFYGELCKDLWASDEEHYVRTSSYLL